MGFPYGSIENKIMRVKKPSRKVTLSVIVPVLLGSVAVTAPATAIAADLRVEDGHCYVDVYDSDIADLARQSEPILLSMGQAIRSEYPQSVYLVQDWLDGLKEGRENQEALRGLEDLLVDSATVQAEDLRAFAAFHVGLMGDSRAQLYRYGNSDGSTREQAAVLLASMSEENSEQNPLGQYGFSQYVLDAISLEVNDFIHARDSFYRTILESCIAGRATEVQFGDVAIGTSSELSSRIPTSSVSGSSVGAVIATGALVAMLVGVIATISEWGWGPAIRSWLSEMTP